MQGALPDVRRTNLLAILFIVAGALGFVVHDTMIKSLSGGYPLHEITFIRGIISAVITLLVLMPLEGGFALRTPRWKFHLLRAVLVVIANMTFYLSLATLPLGDATAIYFFAPLVITALSALLLREHVGPRRWTAVFAGLVGVLLVVRPGAEAFQPASILPLISAACYGLLQVMTRMVGLKEKASTMSFYMQVAFIVFSGAVGLAFGDGSFSGSADPSVEFLLRAWVWPPRARLGDAAGDRRDRFLRRLLPCPGLSHRRCGVGCAFRVCIDADGDPLRRHLLRHLARAGCLVRHRADRRVRTVRLL